MFSPIRTQAKTSSGLRVTERGAGFAEYAFLLALVALAGIVALEALGVGIRESLADTMNAFP